MFPRHSAWTCLIRIASCVRNQALSGAVKEAEQDKKIQALVLRSANPSIFSAGLDLQEMHKPEMDRLRNFWTSFQQLYIDLHGSRLACIAAIEGHAPAAGCMLALSCDYRIMASDMPKITIGLNETRLGKLGQCAVDWFYFFR